MRVFYSTDFEGLWPVGTSAVVVASSEEEARAMLEKELSERLLAGAPFTIHELATDKPSVLILQDGNY